VCLVPLLKRSPFWKAIDIAKPRRDVLTEAPGWKSRSARSRPTPQLSSGYLLTSFTV
jgi:hypothetical protein